MIISLILWFLIGIATAYLAQQRGRDPYIWCAIGLLLGLLGMLLLFLLPSLNSDDENKEASLPLIPISEDQSAPNAYDFLSKEWFCVNKHLEQQGPMSAEALKTLWVEGNVDASSFVWCEGMAEWKKIADLPDLLLGLQELKKLGK